MGQIVDLMEDAFEKIANDGERLLDEQFMMNIFEPVVNQVDPFVEYLEYIFEKKEAHELCTRGKRDKWLPFDELEQNCSFRLVTMYAKHMIRLAVWQKLLRQHSLLSLEIQRKQHQNIYQVLAG